jgi:hypothetical protein
MNAILINELYNGIKKAASKHIPGFTSEGKWKRMFVEKNNKTFIFSITSEGSLFSKKTNRLTVRAKVNSSAIMIATFDGSCCDEITWNNLYPALCKEVQELLLELPDITGVRTKEKVLI